jgi:hypothetical protein
MFGIKGVCPNYSFTDIPLEALPHLDTKLISPRLQISLQTEVHSWSPLINIFIPYLANTRFAEEDTNKGRIILFGPFLDWEYQWVGVVLRWVAELEVPIHGKL